MEGICVNFLGQVQFFRFLKVCCRGNQFCVVSKTQTTCDFCNFYTIWKSFAYRWQIWNYFLNISRDVAMATNFVSYRTCSLGAEVSQDPLDRFSQSLHHMVGVEWQMINPTFFFRYLKGRCHGNQFSAKNGAKLPTPLHLSLCHSETEWDIALRIRALIAPLIALHRVKRWWKSF